MPNLQLIQPESSAFSATPKQPKPTVLAVPFKFSTSYDNQLIHSCIESGRMLDLSYMFRTGGHPMVYRNSMCGSRFASISVGTKKRFRNVRKATPERTESPRPKQVFI